MPVVRKVFVALNKSEYEQLVQLAKLEERIVEQQARFIIKRALEAACAAAAAAAEEVTSDA